MNYATIAEDLKKKSYYKYFNNPSLTPVSEEKMTELIGQAGNPEKGLEFKDRAKLQAPTYQTEPSGYYILKDGGILFTAVTEVPNITADMINWWFMWHQFDHLRYSLWDTEDHKGIRIIPENLERFMDESIPFAERLWGTKSYPTETLNGEEPSKAQEFEIPFISPKEGGLENDKVGTDACLALISANAIHKIGPLEMPVFMAEELRFENGKTIWVARWWMGCGIKNGQDHIVPLPMRKRIAQQNADLVIHSYKEMTHLNKVLPKLYAEYRHLPLNHN